MPAVERMDLTQWAVRWRATGADEYNEPVRSAPTEIRCRWVKTRSLTGNPLGGSQSRDVDLAAACPLNLGDLLWPGRLDEMPGTAEALPDSDVYEVISDGSVRDVKGRAVRYEYGLVRYGRTLPPSDGEPAYDNVGDDPDARTGEDV